MSIEEILDSQIISKLVYGWGNQGWSAKEGYLRTCTRMAASAKGDILECGSGLTTIVIGLIAKRRGLKMISLEHNQSWANKVNKYLKKLNLSNVEIQVVPIKSYNDYHWYDVAGIDIPKTFLMVICDGPPAQTPGGRYGLVPVMQEYFSKGTKILMDDTIREEERRIIEGWKNLIYFSEEKVETEDKHSILSIN